MCNDCTENRIYNSSHPKADILNRQNRRTFGRASLFCLDKDSSTSSTRIQLCNLAFLISGTIRRPIFRENTDWTEWNLFRCWLTEKVFRWNSTKLDENLRTVDQQQPGDVSDSEEILVRKIDEKKKRDRWTCWKRSSSSTSKTNEIDGRNREENIFSSIEYFRRLSDSRCTESRPKDLCRSVFQLNIRWNLAKKRTEHRFVYFPAPTKFVHTVEFDAFVSNNLMICDRRVQTSLRPEKLTNTYNSND